MCPYFFDTIKVIMKKLFVLGIALFFCLFYTGCSWVTTPPIIPDDGGMDEYDPQFISLLNELNTLSKLMSYLKDSTQYGIHIGIYTPYEFFLKKEGDCADYSVFSCYVLHYHNYVVNSVKIDFFNEFSDHVITVFAHKNTDQYPGYTLAKYGYISGRNIYPTGYFNTLDTIEDCVYNFTKWPEGEGYIVKSYEVHPWNYCGYRTMAR